MTEEERQRKMDFILEQQAQFAVDMQALREAQDRTDQQLALCAETQSEFIQIVTQSIQALTKVQKDLAEAQARTEERLNILINTVERHISDGHKHAG
jgi:hypothetical protein